MGVEHEERRLGVGRVGVGRRAGPGEWPRPPHDGHGLEAGDVGVAIDQRQIAVAVAHVDAPAPLEPRQHRGREGAEVGRLAERHGVAEPAEVAVDDLLAGHGHAGGENGVGLGAVEAAAGVDERDGAVGLAVVGGEEAHDLVAAGHGPWEHDDVGADGRVAVVDLDHRAVGVHREGLVRRGHRALVVLPAGIEDAAVRHEAGVDVVEDVEAELPRIRPVGAHHVEDGRVDVAAAHDDVVGAIRREGDLAVRQVERLGVVLGMGGETADLRAIGASLIDVVLLGAGELRAAVASVAEGEEEAVGVPVEAQVAVDAVAERIHHGGQPAIGPHGRQPVDGAARRVDTVMGIHEGLLGRVGLAFHEEHGLEPETSQQQLVAERAGGLEAVPPVHFPVAQCREPPRCLDIRRVVQDLLDAA